VDTIAESRVGHACRLMITVPAVFHAIDHLRLVRTAAIIHVTTAFPVLPAICPVTHVANITDAPRSVAIRVTLARSNVDGDAIIDAIAAVCHVRSHAISFLAIVAAKRTLYLVDTDAQGFVARSVRIPNFARSAVGRTFVSGKLMLSCCQNTAKLRLMRTR
jgi:hypothetical protein